MFIAGLILLVIGGAMIAGARWGASNALRKDQWPQVPGKIIRIRTGHVQVNRPGPARALVEKYPVGASVSVYVHPDNMLATVLEPGGDSCAAPFMIGMAVVIMIIGLLLMI